ncbi:hypothetical protein BX666DRAFT_2033262 [Dichotomocladium elegans]|nr:hypothetical protein BX666DRAFT_2033262 [Dichotomocladium elegans]
MQFHHHDHLPGRMHISPSQPNDRISNQHKVGLPTVTSDITRHLACLKTRLNFACFKLNNGWETNTLIDVELMWKKRQRKLYNEIPTPRFTQQDILDKRGQFSSAKLKKARLYRTYSAPQTPSQYRKRKLERQRVDRSPSYDYHPTTTITATEATAPLPPSTQDSFLSYSPPPSSLDANQAPHLKNSLDYLSYAIEMTEAHKRHGCASPPSVGQEHIDQEISMSSSQPQPDISRIKPNLYDDDDGEGGEYEAMGDEDVDAASHERSTLRSTWRNSRRSASFQHDGRSPLRVRPYSSAETESDDQPSPPSSPATAAAHAIMMFVNDHYVSTDSPAISSITDSPSPSHLHSI